MMAERAYCVLRISERTTKYATSVEKPVIDFDQYQWKQRLLVVFAPQGDDRAYLAQQRLIEGSAALLTERDLIVLHVVATANAGDAVAARQRFQVASSQFTLVLVGKDGSVKQQWHQPTALSEIAVLIDGMPMRQQEQRQRA